MDFVIRETVMAVMDECIAIAKRHMSASRIVTDMNKLKEKLQK